LLKKTEQIGFGNICSDMRPLVTFWHFIAHVHEIKYTGQNRLKCTIFVQTNHIRSPQKRHRTAGDSL